MPQQAEVPKVHRKFLVAIIAILLVGIVAPVMIPKGHADDSYESLTVTGFSLRNYNDPYYGCCVNGVPAGGTLTFTAYFAASSYPVFQRNITIGVKFDWMTNFQNTSTPIAIQTSQSGYITLQFTLPTTAGLNQAPHTWAVDVWDLPMGGTWIYTCPWYTYEVGNTSCHQFTGSGVVVYSGPQASAILTMQQASAEINALSSVLSSTKQAPPGTSTAVADLAAASVQLSLANQAYATGDFSTAQTDSQNALNEANAAQSSLATTGGGTDAATMTSIWLNAVAVIMGGIGAILLGLGGFKYLRGKTRAITGYTPSAPKA